MHLWRYGKYFVEKITKDQLVKIGENSQPENWASRNLVQPVQFNFNPNWAGWRVLRKITVCECKFSFLYTIRVQKLP